MKELQTTVDTNYANMMQAGKGAAILINTSYRLLNKAYIIHTFTGKA